MSIRTISEKSSKNLMTPILDTLEKLETKAIQMYEIRNFEYLIKLESRESRTIGSFSWRYPGHSFEFFFNVAYLATNSKEQFDEVIVHEFCHFLTLKIYGPNVRPHGTEWKKIMREFGGVAKPMALNKNVANKAKVVYACDCTLFASSKHKDKLCCQCGQKVVRY